MFCALRFTALVQSKRAAQMAGQVQVNTLIIGIGNEWASDDGVGPEVVQRVREQWQRDERDSQQVVEFSILTQPDLSLLDRMVGYANLIIVDAVVGDQPPGTVHHETWEPGVLAARGVQRTSSHGFGVRELLEMAAVIGKLPERIELWGIEIASTEPGQGFSAAVAVAVDDVVGRLLAYLDPLRIPVILHSND